MKSANQIRNASKANLGAISASNTILGSATKIRDDGRLNSGVELSLVSGNHTDSLLGIDIRGVGEIPNPAGLPGAGWAAAEVAADAAMHAVLDPQHLNTPADDPSGPLSAGLGIGQPGLTTATTPDPNSLVSRASRKPKTNVSVGVDHNVASLETSANNSAEITHGQIGNEKKLLTPLATSSDKSEQYSHGTNTIPNLQAKTIPIPRADQIPPDGNGNTHGDGAGTSQNRPTGGATNTPSGTAPTRSLPQFPFPSSSSPVVSTGGPNTSDSSILLASDTTNVASVATGVDLILEDIRLASPATLVAGPAYSIKFRNQGMAAAGAFHVGMLVGVDGQLTNDAPRAVVEVQSLAAGAASEVTLRLPQKALKLAAADGKPTAFTHLFVAIDLLNTVAESDEANNTAVLERPALEGGIATN